MTPLVNHTRTHLTLITLLSKNTPDEVVAMAAKSRLGKEGCHKFMSIDLVDLSFLQSFLPFSCKLFMGSQSIHSFIICKGAGERDGDIHTSLWFQIHLG